MFDEMENKHGLQVLAILLLVVASVLAGCGGAAPATTPPVTATTPPVTATTPAATPKITHALEGFEDCAGCHHGAGIGGAKTVPGEHCCDMCHPVGLRFDHLDPNDSCTLCHKVK